MGKALCFHEPSQEYKKVIKYLYTLMETPI